VRYTGRCLREATRNLRSFREPVLPRRGGAVGVPGPGRPGGGHLPEAAPNLSERRCGRRPTRPGGDVVPRTSLIVAARAVRVNGRSAVFVVAPRRPSCVSTATAAPWEASRRTIAAPIPRLPPVTKARLPLRLDVDVIALPVPSPSFALVKYLYYCGHTSAPLTTAAGARSLRGRRRVRNAASAALRARRRGRVGGGLTRRRWRRV
jgi:hypothetical protein